MDPPARLTYPGQVTPEWACNVAEHALYELLTLANKDHVQIRELWVSDDLSIWMRHVRVGVQLGLRHDELGADPMIGTPARTSDLIGDSVYHSIYDTPAVRDWCDPLGFEWWGDEPTEGWAAGVDRPRLCTVFSRS